MKKETTKGTCNFCQGEFEKGKMTQHLKFCKQRAASLKTANTQEAQKTRMLLLTVEGYRLPQYWMYLEVPATETLTDLDDFLRDIWLECCDHLSAFTIGHASYTSAMPYWGFGDQNASIEE